VNRALTDVMAESLESPTLDSVTVYREHADFVWRSLQRLGVRNADLEDLLQEVFVVVHRRLDHFEGQSQVSTWLFGICTRVVRHHRRLAWFRRVSLPGKLPDQRSERTPEDEALQRCAVTELEQALSRLSPEHHAVFVLFEFEGKTCEEISELMAVPIGTTYSRLHAARRNFQKLTAASCRRNKEPCDGP
jgi:RNA polymerase sigma-70 factor, ECF subfamily